MASKYICQAADTSREAEKIQFAIWRSLPISVKVQQVRSFNLRMRKILWQTICEKFPQLCDRQRKRELIEFTLAEQFENIDALIEQDFMIQDPLELAAAIGKILDHLNIPYFVGGGLASSILGEVRTTQDADLAVLLSRTDAPQLISQMQSDFYISQVAVEDALNDRTNSFNVIHLGSALKADIYPIRVADEFQNMSLTRRRRVELNESSDLSFYICSAEDIVLQKLIWYRLAGNESYKQWRDILGVLKLQGEQLDFGYLKQWATRLGLVAECDRAFSEAGLPDR